MSGDFIGQIGEIRFRNNANNTYTMIFGRLGEKPTTVALKLSGKNVATMYWENVKGPTVYIRNDGWIIEWPTWTNGYEFFNSTFDNASGHWITTFTVVGDKLIENRQSNRLARVDFKPAG